MRVRYMILIASSEDAWDGLSEERRKELYNQIAAWWGEQYASGKVTEGAELQPASTATTVRVDRSGGATVTDGPFMEAKEIVGGYGILNVADLDEAIKIVSTWPGPTTIEIRPIVER